MGRTILADESVQNYSLQILKSDKWHIGLIIGQLTTQKDYVVKLVRTPEPAEDICTEEEEGDVEATPTKKRRRSSQKPDSLVKVDDKWTATHAKQVTRMLPGGLDVIGVFAVAPPTMMQDAQSKLRQILYSIHKTLKKTHILPNDDAISERLLLQICADTKKFTCKSIDVTDPKSSFRPAELKVQSSSEKWIQLHCQLNLNIHVASSITDQSQSMLKQIQAGILPFCRSLQCGLATINGSLRTNSELLDQSQSESKRSKGRDRGQTTPQQKYLVDYLVQQNYILSGDPVVSDCSSSIAIRGQVHGRAYVPSRATVGEGIQAMTSDLIRSLNARCELLCEDIELVEEDTVMKELYDTPVRVFGKLSGSQVEFCDYMFQDEKIEEVTDRIKDLLDVTVSENDLDMTCERVATELDWACAKQQPQEVDLEMEGSKSSLRDLGLRIGAAAAGLLAVIVAGASYLFMDDT